MASIEIYMLGKAGVELFPDRSRKKPNILWLNHSLAINQFYIDLKLYCEDSYYIRLAKFIPEYNINFEAFYHRADAGINLFSRLLNKPFFFFLEVDRSTESLERLKEMLYGYYLLFYYNDFRLLIVCDSTRRLNNIRKFMADQFETLFYHFCWMKTAEAPLSHWKSLDIKDKKDYDIKRDIVTRAAHSLRMERSAAECRAV